LALPVIDLKQVIGKFFQSSVQFLLLWPQTAREFHKEAYS
jgi:hypothetical protein